MKQIGFDEIVGMGPWHSVAVRIPVMSIARVRWDLVDPIGTTVPKQAAHGTPVFVSGDAVSWAYNRGLAGQLSLIPQMIHVEDEPVERGATMVGNLESRGRMDSGNGFGLRLPTWDGFAVQTMRVGPIRPCEEDAARRHVEYHARRSEWSRGGRSYNQNRSERISRPQVARVNRMPVLESPPPLPSEIRKPVNGQYRAPCRVGRNVRDNHHTKRPVQNGSNDDTSVARTDPIEVPGNPRKRPINSVGLNEEVERVKKRIPSSDDARYQAPIPRQTELNTEPVNSRPTCTPYRYDPICIHSGCESYERVSSGIFWC